MLRQVALFSMRDFSGAVIMPNPRARWSVVNAHDVLKYGREIKMANVWELPFSPIMAIKITDDTTTEMVAEASVAGARVGKVYPRGTTTHSHDGVSDLRRRSEIFQAMEKLGMILSIHAEDPSVYHEDREATFIEKHLAWVVFNFPRLRVGQTAFFYLPRQFVVVLYRYGGIAR